MRPLRWKAAVIAMMLCGAAAWPVDWQSDTEPASPEHSSQSQLPVERPSTSQSPSEQTEPQEPGLVPPIAWEESLDAALSTARRRNKPLLIEFYVGYQQWCRLLEEKTLTDTGVLELANRFVCVRIDGKESSETARQFNVTGYPTIVFLNPRGETVHRVIGFIPARPFEREMKEIAEGREPEKELEKLERSNPREFRPLVMLAVGYLRRQEWDKAIATYERALEVGPGIESRDTHEVIYSLCQLYDFRKKPEKSERLLLQLLRTRNSDKVKVHDLLGHTYLSLRQPQKAVEHFRAERALVEDEKQQEFLDRLIERIRKAQEKQRAPR